VGTLKVLANDQGETIKAIDYDSFGNVLVEEWPWLFVPLGFAGGLRDRHTGLVRFGCRDYDPEVGRFTAQDPLGDTGGDHDPYEYCVDDPVNAVDPTGLKPKQADGPERGEPSKEPELIPHDKLYWTFLPKPNACDRCQAMKDLYFEEEQPRPHPNCKCELKTLKASELPYDRNRIIVPPGVSLDKNLAEAKTLGRNLIELIKDTIANPNNLIENEREAGTIVGYIYDSFRTGGKYDYKQLGIQYEPFGNYHYGTYMKSTGCPELLARMIAGGYQVYSGMYEWENWRYFFDYPDDQYNIQRGMDSIQ
jgi:RHS repeat-associated protein